MSTNGNPPLDEALNSMGSGEPKQDCTLVDIMALLDGGSIYIKIVDQDSTEHYINLDMGMDSPTRGMVFSSLVEGREVRLDQDKNKIIALQQSLDSSQQNDAVFVNKVIHALQGIVEQSTASSGLLPDFWLDESDD